MRAISRRADRLPLYGLLLVALLGEIMLVPMIVHTWHGMAVARVATAAVLAAGLLAVGATHANLAGFVLVLGALVSAALWRSPAAVTVALALRTLFVAYVAAAILWNVVQRAQVTLDTIAGAACVYLLLGLAWATSYLLLEHVHPGSFDIPDAWRGRGTGEDLGPALVYFSYVTLTTIGYGDIKPAGPFVGGLVVVEAVVGQLYLAITIARLVGLHIARHD